MPTTRDRAKQRLAALSDWRPAASGVAHALLAALGVAAVFNLEAIVEPIRDLLRPLFTWLPAVRIDPPELDLPAWLDAVLGAGELWWPVVVGMAITASHLRRRRSEPVAS